MYRYVLDCLVKKKISEFTQTKKLFLCSGFEVGTYYE